MIKRLRRRFVLVTVLLLTALLMTILCVIYGSAKLETEGTIDDALQAAVIAPSQPGAAQYLPCFILYLSNEQQLRALGHAYYDLSDQEQLAQLYQEAQSSGKTDGFLEQRSLRFRQRTFWGKEAYVFVDVTTQKEAMQNLVWILNSVFVVGLAAFVVLSWLLARWMIRPVEQAWTRQRQFVADASHELKTPLTVILTNGEMLQSQQFDPPTNQRLTDGILTMAQQMRGLTEGLLELARTDAQPQPQKLTQAVNFSDLAENAVLQFEPVYYEAGRTLDAAVQPGIHVRGNRQNLQQILDILLDNGQKYSTPGTTVRLILEHSRSHCTLRVISQGTTLTHQQCRDIFQRFYRVDEARTRCRSYGLGLPIAQALVQQHRGKIWAQGKDGKNTFTVTMPICHPEK